MNLGKLFTADNHESGADIEILDTDLAKTGITIRIKGIDSPTYREVQAAAEREYIASGYKREQTIAERLAALTIGWDGMPNPDGSGLLEFSTENAEMIYRKGPFIAEQVNRAMANRANFMKTSPQE